MKLTNKNEFMLDFSEKKDNWSVAGMILGVIVALALVWILGVMVLSL